MCLSDDKIMAFWDVMSHSLQIGTSAASLILKIEAAGSS
jgi:hypothetical protein